MCNSYSKFKKVIQVHVFGSCHSLHFNMMNLLYWNKRITVQRDILCTVHVYIKFKNWNFSILYKKLFHNIRYKKSCMHIETQQLCENLGMSNMIHVNLRIADLLTILKITTCTVIVINRKILLPIPWPITLIPFRSMLLLLNVLCTKCIFHIIIHKFSS